MAFNPDQERIPAGSPEGGQFAPAGGGGGNSSSLSHEDLLSVGKTIFKEEAYSNQERSEVKGAVCSALTDALTSELYDEAFSRRDMGRAIELITRGGEKWENMVDMSDNDLAYTLADSVVGQWANTSGDSSGAAVGIQLAAMREFEVEGASISHFGADRGALFDLSAEAMAQSKAMVEQYVKEGVQPSQMPSRVYSQYVAGEIARNPAIRATLRAMYQDTQSYLRQRGITELTLVRGMVDEEMDAQTSFDSAYDPPRNETLVLQPLSSFSTDSDTALDFAGNGAGALLITARVPASRVLAVPWTGSGCLSEKEVVVIGGRLQGRTINMDERPADRAGDILSYRDARLQELYGGAPTPKPAAEPTTFLHVKMSPLEALNAKLNSM